VLFADTNPFLAFWQWCFHFSKIDENARKQRKTLPVRRYTCWDAEAGKSSCQERFFAWVTEKRQSGIVSLLTVR
jgi:hypothetical protein